MSTTDSTLIKGQPACQGKVSGRVQVLKSAQDSAQMSERAVLVTMMTSVDFMPAIKKAIAIVTDLGGITCHAAIISRELDIPCIVGTEVATKILKNGDRVEVNANKGTIKILNHEN